jgi:Flp pilus assembly pilin Flp
MFNMLLVKLHVAMLTLVGMLALRTRSTRRGAEFIEVALYAAIILIIAGVFRSTLSGAFTTLVNKISAALGNTGTG